MATGGLKRTREPCSLFVREAAKILCVARPTLSSLLNAKSDLSGDIALRFEKVFGVDNGLSTLAPMETLMRLHSFFDIVRTRSREKRIKVPRYEPAKSRTAT